MFFITVNDKHSYINNKEQAY